MTSTTHSPKFTAKQIAALPVGHTFGPYTVVYQQATRIAISDSSGTGKVSGNRNRNASYRWYNHNSPIISAKLAYTLSLSPEAEAKRQQIVRLTKDQDLSQSPRQIARRAKRAASKGDA